MKYEDLQPAGLWKWFGKICSIPHPSFNEEKLVEFVINWAKDKGYFAGQDKVGNVRLLKPATQGKESYPRVCLQAHFDMVPQANSNKQHDFLKDPIVPVIKNGYVYADDTTLGADNGIGLASILAIFDDDTLEHGPLEALLTVDEEVSMIGAVELQENWLESEFMINTDTEEIGELYLGCAGGYDIGFLKDYEFKALKENSSLYKLALRGLRGGHSGCDIHTNRESAIKYLNLVLFLTLQEVKFNLCEYFSGQAVNAIAREAECVVAVTQQNKDKFEEVLARVSQQVRSVIAHAEQESQFEMDYLGQAEQLTEYKRLSCSQMPNLLAFLVNLPNGVIRNSDLLENTVETSISVGVVRLNQQDKFVYKALGRSTDDFSNELQVTVLKEYAKLAGFDVEVRHRYPGWKPENNSFSDFVAKKYSQVMGYEVSVKVIHAGLECGIIKGHYPNMKLVSIGPNIHNPHTPKEHVEIASVETYWKALTAILKDFGEVNNKL